MFLRLFVFACLFVLINAQNNNEINKFPQSGINIPVAEHEPSHADDHSRQTTTERTLIRVTRLNAKPEKRSRRQIIETIQTAGIVLNVAKAIQNTESGEKIMGMAKKVAIAVIVIVSLCIVGCLVMTVVICIKCCCNGSNRKRNQGPTTVQVPQPIFVHTGPGGYHSQQALQSWSPVVIQSPESRPMLPQPSAPPRPQDNFHIEHPPPPYENSTQANNNFIRLVSLSDT